jgi:hypothetical protein
MIEPVGAFDSEVLLPLALTLGHSPGLPCPQVSACPVCTLRIAPIYIDSLVFGAWRAQLVSCGLHRRSVGD